MPRNFRQYAPDDHRRIGHNLPRSPAVFAEAVGDVAEI